MLNRFKNALYGNPSVSDNETSDTRDEYREVIIGKRIRNVIKRSTSFQEDLSRRPGADPQYNHIPHRTIHDVTMRLASQAKSGEDLRSYNLASKVPKFHYSRPEFLQLKTDDEILVSADHQIRPIILPRDTTRLPWKSGYAECINAGKSMRNEDQASCYQDVLFRRFSTTPFQENDLIAIENQLPWYYFGIFDGHAGTAVAVAAAKQLHNIIGEKLNQIADLLIALEFDLVEESSTTNGIVNDDKKEFYPSVNSIAEEDEEKQDKAITLNEDNKNALTNDKEVFNNNDESVNEKITKITTIDNNNSTITTKRESLNLNYNNNNNNKSDTPTSMIDIFKNNITVDKLIVGALESAFWDMDEQIGRDKDDYKMAGGCTANVGLFILGKLYVCNAGDSRAIVCYKNGQVLPMSFDFTPTSEKQRILKLGLQRPEFLGTDFTHLEFLRRPTRKDLGKQMLYRNAYMTGWSMKKITYDDLKFPLVWGEGKRSRVLATIGVTRGFGDHELRAQYGSVLIKPFLTPEPDVRILNLEKDHTLTPEDVLIIGTDGLWDVTTNEEAAEIVKNSFDLFPDNEESRSKYRYITAAQDLVIHSRGQTTNWNNVWRTENNDKLASLDDIAVFVIPLKQYRDEYIQWKQQRSESVKSRAIKNQNNNKQVEEEEEGGEGEEGKNENVPQDNNNN